MWPALICLATLQGPDRNQIRDATEIDHRQLLKNLGIESLRPGVNGMDPNAPNYANTDESKANPYPCVPDVLTFKNGRPVRTVRDWQKRRLEILEDLDREVYGRTPKRLPKVRWEVRKRERVVFEGIEVEDKDLVGIVDNRSHPAISVEIKMRLTTPENARKVPVILELGFPMPPGARRASGSTAAEPSWQKQVLDRGWGFAILEPGTVQADNGAGLTKGIIGLTNKGLPRRPDQWGALKAWSWGASRALDYLATDPSTDAKQVAIEGLSRYGKAAAVAMAYEPRFAAAFVGSSGQGGLKIWRRNFGETVENVASSGEYHWMAGNFVKYAGPLTPNDLPVDAHMLAALCAPRPLFVGVGSLKVEGIWIDPVGTFQAVSLASPVYRLLGRQGLGTSTMPPEGTPLVEGDLAFSQHHGGHTNGPNWPVFLQWISRSFDRKTS